MPKVGVISLGWWYYLLGLVEAQEGHPEVGLERCQKAAQMQEQAVRQNRGTANYRSDWLWSREQIGLLQVEKTPTSAATQVAVQAQLVREREELAQGDPENPQWQYEVAEGYVRLAELRLKAGLLPEVGLALKQCLEILDKITRVQQPENYEFQRLQAYALGVQSQLQTTTGNQDGALASARQGGAP